MRKPMRLDTANRSVIKVYADFDRTKGCCVYIGGRYYEETAQIHLSEPDVHALAGYLAKASAYIKSRKLKER